MYLSFPATGGGCRNLGKETELNEMPAGQMVPERSIIVYHDKACTN